MSLLILLLLPATLHPRRRLGQDVAVFTEDPLNETKVEKPFFLPPYSHSEDPKLK